MAGKKCKTEAQKSKSYNNSVSRNGKWRGKKANEYTKYIKRKREEVKDWKFHPFFGFMLLNPKKYGKKWIERRNKILLNKKGGYEALKKTKQL